MLFEIHLDGNIQDVAGTLYGASIKAMELIGLGKVEILIIDVEA